MEIQQAQIEVKGNAEARQVQTKNGPKTVYEQSAVFSKDGMMFPFPLSVNSPAEAYPLGRYQWDVVADIQPSIYGPELARRLTLVSLNNKQPAQAAAKQ